MSRGLSEPRADNALVEAAVDALAESVELAKRTGDNSYMFTSGAGVRYDWLPQADGTVIIRGTQNVQSILDANQAEFNDDKRGWSADKAFRRVARIPAAVRNKVLIETRGQVDLWKRGAERSDTKWINRFLNDIDNRKLRTAPGRL